MATAIAFDSSKEKVPMKSQARRVSFRLAQLMILTAVAFSVPALAQFEVSPDHFDPTLPTDKRQAAKPTATKAKGQSAASSASTAKNQSNGVVQASIVASRGKTSDPNPATRQAATRMTAAKSKAIAAKRKKPAAADKLALATTH
jgi:hypothetical protein